ncbi:MAG: M15 family metallopeptidase [Candidatus Paceibacterota bacterium]|jgi:hypothetical protein
MKKILSYILILIGLIGLFNLPVRAEAADPMGSCKTTIFGEVRIFPDTHPNCTARGGEWSETTQTCPPPKVLSTTSNICVDPPPASAERCFVNGVQKEGISTKSACDEINGIWATVPPTPDGPRGTCIVEGATLSGSWTEAACRQQPNFKQWLPEAAPRGTCIIGSRTEHDWTKAACDLSGGSWRPNLAEDTKYYFLSPLPCTGTPESGCVDGKLKSFDPIGDNKLGAYLNLMIKIFIGICAVLAVIMIVMGGIEYMMTELVSGKEAGRERIRNALLGLLLALGAYTLLNTINPNILITDIPLPNQGIIVTLEPELESPQTAVLTDEGAPSGPTPGCPEGIGRTAGGISVCNSIVAKVNDMITAAKNANPSCVLTGGGYRSLARQVELRQKNCHGDTTNKNPNPACNPPTALPGNSRHQQGLAIDFQSSGRLIETRDNVCFLWLSAHAGPTLKNLPSEPWHWSIDGN